MIKLQDVTDERRGDASLRLRPESCARRGTASVMPTYCAAAAAQISLVATRAFGHRLPLGGGHDRHDPARAGLDASSAHPPAVRRVGRRSPTSSHLL